MARKNNESDESDVTGEGASDVLAQAELPSEQPRHASGNAPKGGLTAALRAIRRPLAPLLNGRANRREQRRIRHDYQILHESDWFDPDWYSDRYPDVAESGTDPLLHFVRHGAAEGRNPSERFSCSSYLDLYPDVRHARVNPLVHYLVHGRTEGRRPVPVTPSTNIITPPERRDPYQVWIAVNRPTEAAVSRLREALDRAGGSLPTISVVMPVFRPPMAFLEAAIESVAAQIYSDWELCIHVDGDDDPLLLSWLTARRDADHRIRLSIGDENAGIAAATNMAAALATGEYIAFLDQDDLLTPDALAQVALAGARGPDVDVVYSDDDKISTADDRYAPQFKPDWSLVLLLSYMYISHFLVVRRSLFDALGGFRTGFDGSQDYDFALRVAEQARSVVHIPTILYHWRAVGRSIASTGDAKPHSIDAGLRAVGEACLRRGIPAKAVHPDWAAQANIGVFKLVFPDHGPRVTIIIPTRNRVDLLRPCVESIEQRTRYKNYEILIVDNESDDAETLSYLRSCGHKVTRLANRDRFNFASMINRAVEAAAGPYVLLLNNDTEVRSGDWLSQMVGYAGLPNVAAVGAKLIYPDETIQHAGVVHGLHGDLAGHAFRGMPVSAHGYLGYAMVSREYCAVTAACMLVDRETYLSSGGMDADNFAVAYNDVDFCYRLVAAGYRCVYCADAELIHREGSTRGYADNPFEEVAFRERYRNFRDLSYNPNLSLDDEQFTVRPRRYVAPELVENPIRVAFFSHNLNHEGAPNCLFELVCRLKKDGLVEPTVVSTTDGPLAADYRRSGIAVALIANPADDAPNAEAYQANLAKVAQRLESWAVEVVFANTAETFWALNAAGQIAVPSIWNIHESEAAETYYAHLPQFLGSAAYSAFHTAYRVVFVAESTRQIWSPLDTAYNFVVIPHGLDLGRLEERTGGCGLDRTAARRRLGLTDDHVALVLLGTVCERKNQRLLVEAVAQMPPERGEQVRVFIVGDRDGHYSRQLHQDRAALPAEWQDSVAIVEETDQPYLYLVAGDIAICTSRRESYPRVTLEAMALGLPLVTTPVFGIAEQAREGVNARFFDPDRSDQLRDALVEMVDDAALRRRFGANSTALFRGLMQFDEMVKRYAEALQEAALSSVVDSSFVCETSFSQ